MIDYHPRSDSAATASCSEFFSVVFVCGWLFCLFDGQHDNFWTVWDEIFIGARYGCKLEWVRIWLHSDALRCAGDDLTRLCCSSCLSNAMHGHNINLPMRVCPSHFLSTRLQVRHLNGFLQFNQSINQKRIRVTKVTNVTARPQLIA